MKKYIPLIFTLISCVVALYFTYSVSQLYMHVHTDHTITYNDAHSPNHTTDFIWSIVWPSVFILYFFLIAHSVRIVVTPGSDKWMMWFFEDENVLHRILSKMTLSLALVVPVASAIVYNSTYGGHEVFPVFLSLLIPYSAFAMLIYSMLSILKMFNSWRIISKIVLTLSIITSALCSIFILPLIAAPIIFSFFLLIWFVLKKRGVVLPFKSVWQPALYSYSLFVVILCIYIFMSTEF